MTNTNLSDDLVPDLDNADRADAPRRARHRSDAPDRADGDRPGGDQPEADKRGAPGNDEPMTDSTEGGLDGGDPGVEE